MKTIERIYQYIEFKGYKPTHFEKEIGLSSGYLNVQKKRNADIGESVINKINDYCLDMNLDWLLTGQGEMLKEEKKQITKIHNQASIWKRLLNTKKFRHTTSVQRLI